MTQSEAESYSGRLLEGIRQFKSAADYFDAAIQQGVCPFCAGGWARKPTLVPSAKSRDRLFCREEFRWITKDYFLSMVIESGRCPTCNRPLIKFGRPTATAQRFRCKTERKVWTFRQPRPESTALSWDQAFRAATFWRLGWSKSRIARAIGARKAEVFRFINFRLGIDFEFVDVATSAWDSTIHICLWDSLLRNELGIPQPFRPTRFFRVGQERESLALLLQHIGAFRDEAKRNTAFRHLFRALESFFLTVASGQFGKEQVGRYRKRVGNHLVELANRLSRGVPRRMASNLGQRCPACSSIKTEDQFLGRVEQVLHRAGLCSDLKQVLRQVEAISTLKPLERDEEQPKYEAPPDLSAIAAHYPR